MIDKELLKKTFELLKNLVPAEKDVNEYAEIFYAIKRDLGIPVDKKRVFLIGGNFHGQSVDENSVKYKWPPFRYIRHPAPPLDPAVFRSNGSIFYNEPDEVYELVKFTTGELAYLYRQTIVYDPRKY